MQIERTNTFEAHSINAARYTNKQWALFMEYTVSIEIAVRHDHWTSNVYRLEHKTIPVHE